MKTIIAGGRDCVDGWALEAALECCPFRISSVVCGMARGVDTMGKQWAEFHGLPVHCFPADWEAHGRAAGPIRNLAMLNAAEALLALWDGKSRGTGNMIAIAKARGIPVHVWAVE